MKIFYLINSRIPSEKAEGLEAMKLCEALGELAEVVMVAPFRFNAVKSDPFLFYGVKRNFKIIRLPVIDLISFFSHRATYALEATSFSFASVLYLLFFSQTNNVIFGHDQISLFPASFFRKNVFYDIHDFPKGRLFLYRRFFKNLRGIVTTNQWKKSELVKKFSILEDKIISCPNGVDFEEFDVKISKTEARKKLGLPQDKFLVGYVGMLRTMGMEKGIDTAIKALEYLPENVVLMLVGGNKQDIGEYESLAEKKGVKNRVLFAGFVKHEMIPFYLKAFDALIAPFPKTDHYEYYMCPMKVIEYMASGRPMVVSDLHSIREIVSEKECVFVRPDDAKSLSDGIKTLMNNESFAKEISENALKKARNFSWENRARTIVDFMSR